MQSQFSGIYTIVIIQNFCNYWIPNLSIPWFVSVASSELYLGWPGNNPKACSFLRSCNSLKIHVNICIVFTFSMSVVEITNITAMTYKHSKIVQKDQIVSRHQLFAKLIFLIEVKLYTKSLPVWGFFINFEVMLPLVWRKKKKPNF